MAIDFERLSHWSFPEKRHLLTRRDTMLYALGVGLGMPADDPAQLDFLYEPNLLALPTMAVVLGYRGFWLQDPQTGVDWKKVLHGEQRITLHAPLPVEGEVISRQFVSALIDRGLDKGAILTLTRELLDEQGALLARIEHLSMLRGDGGFGQSFGTAEPPAPVPMRQPDIVTDLPMSERAALIYRLSGDYNPLHIDPAVARSAGFHKPIVHGLCTFGLVGHALLKAHADYQPQRIRGLGGRFSAPVFPGETIRVESWDDRKGRIAIRARALERDVVIFDRGLASIVDMGTPWDSQIVTPQDVEESGSAAKAQRH
ncbi:3-alpha,7-alpha,12-alpha-trihydroxy-5-beta-cholest-24-enoyl-CoA hydratase [Sphingobium baderi LL03]|nr:3-alpha,7-alpha,12-alpha-trihydroxy-5-beta-cholest-24-enoyl-CoA hydratase [Sphingobium baderi LL03]